MKQRKKQPVVTRQLILDAAGEQFSRDGYSATGLGPMVIKAGLTKGALFHHFPDKRALALAWVSGDLMNAIGKIWIYPLSEIRSLDGLQAFCRARCLDLGPEDATSALVAIAAETAAVDLVLGAALEEVFVAWRTAVAGLLEKGKSAVWIHYSIQPPVEAAILVSAFSGLSITTKCNPDVSFRRTFATGLEGYLETLRPQ